MQMMRTPSIELERMALRLLAASLVVAAGAWAGGAEGPAVIGFRGEPCGGYPQARPPLHISPTENLRWKAAVGEGCGSPISVGERVFVQAAPNALVCLDKATGRELWRREQHAGDLPADHPASRLEAVMSEVGILQKMKRRKNALPQGSPERAAAEAELTERLQRLPPGLPVLHGAGIDVAGRRDGGGYNSAGYYLICLTPCSDGKSVVALFPTGVVVSYDLEGRRQWNFGLRPGTGRDDRVEDGVHAPAPIFTDGKVLVLFGSQIVCLDGATGRILWNGKLRSSLASPVAGRVGKETYVATGDGHIFRLRDGRVAYADPKGGNHESPVSPVFAAGVFYWAEHAVKVTDAEPPTGEALWDLAGPTLAKLTGWGVTAHARVGPGDMTSPVILGDRLLFYNQRTQLVALDARTGNEIGERRSTRPAQRVQLLARGVTKNWAYGGLVLAGDYLIVVHDNGLVKAIPVNEAAGPVVCSALDDDIYARPACDGTALYMRTVNALYCFENQGPQAGVIQPGEK